MTINWNVSWPKHQRVLLAICRPFMDRKKRTRKRKSTILNRTTLASLIMFTSVLTYYPLAFLEVDFSVAKTLTLAIEIFRCKMKQGQLQIENTGKNLNKWMLHVTKLRLTWRYGLQRVGLVDQCNEVFQLCSQVFNCCADVRACLNHIANHAYLAG